jgi:hypothetical protein
MLILDSSSVWTVNGSGHVFGLPPLLNQLLFVTMRSILCCGFALNACEKNLFKVVKFLHAFTTKSCVGIGAFTWMKHLLSNATCARKLFSYSHRVTLDKMKEVVTVETNV